LCRKYIFEGRGERKSFFVRALQEQSVVFHSIKKTPFYADYIATAIEIRVETAFFLHYALCPLP